MSYSEYQQTAAYRKAKSGAQLTVVIIDMSDPKYKPLARGSGLTITDTIEQNEVPEWGKATIEEYVEGKMRFRFNLSSFFVPKQNDEMLTSRTFQGKEFMILQVTSEKWPDGGNVVNALIKARFSGRNINQGAAGLVGDNADGVACDRLTGQEYADQYGA